MTNSRCAICLQQMPTLRYLKNHYYSHSKIKIIQSLLRHTVLVSNYPNLPKRKQRRTKMKLPRTCKKIKLGSKTETLYMNENIHILCGENGIIIGDDKSSVDLEFSFDDTSNSGKDTFIKQEDDMEEVPKSKTDTKRIKNHSEYYSRSPSASSEGSVDSPRVKKKRIRRKKVSLKKHGHYQINISKLNEQPSLDENSGEFYTCHCRENINKKPIFLTKSDMRIITSDTESCSDTGKNFFMPIIDTKIFCKECGSGYKTQTELMEHMHVHDTFCRVCNMAFSNQYIFKKHMRLHFFKVYLCHVCKAEFPSKELLVGHFEYHVEDKALETILDMEEDYKIHRFSFMNMNCNSIDSILYYLTENHDMYYYNYKFMKIICDICGHEVFYGEYERHLQNVHYAFHY